MAQFIAVSKTNFDNVVKVQNAQPTVQSNKIWIDNTATGSYEVYEKSQVDAITGALPYLTTTDKTSLVNAVNELDSDIGDLSTLTTAEKDDIVAAVNELDSDILPLQYNVSGTAKQLNVIGITDLNNAPIGVYYYGATLLNIPPFSQYGVVSTFYRNANHMVQIAYGITAQGTGVRHKISGTWSEWQQLALHKDVYPLIYFAQATQQKIGTYGSNDVHRWTKRGTLPTLTAGTAATICGVPNRQILKLNAVAKNTGGTYLSNYYVSSTDHMTFYVQGGQLKVVVGNGGNFSGQPYSVQLIYAV